ncbi:MAG TPA: PEP-CTERM sorting domain-containing protein [Burkholderiales bacterium]|nr:PEP-CTERM sorting domain-containing protein [Burkholderiales bacterium]
MKKLQLLIGLTLVAASGIANAQLSFLQLATASRTEVFNNIQGIADKAIGTSVKLGSLSTGQAGIVTFTYLGQESGYNDKFHLTVNGTDLFESNPVGTSISAQVNSTGLISFKFEGDAGKFAVNGPMSGWAGGTSIGLIGTNLQVTSGGGQGTYAYVLGYNDSAGSASLGDWDDFVVGVNFKVSAIPEPETFAMLLAGLGLMGFVARRRKQNQRA